MPSSVASQVDNELQKIATTYSTVTNDANGYIAQANQSGCNITELPQVPTDGDWTALREMLLQDRKRLITAEEGARPVAATVRGSPAGPPEPLVGVPRIKAQKTWAAASRPPGIRIACAPPARAGRPQASRSPPAERCRWRRCAGPGQARHAVPCSLSLTSCLVRRATLRLLRFPSGPKPSETAPTYLFLVASK